jgi:hypothetical protein
MTIIYHSQLRLFLLNNGKSNKYHISQVCLSRHCSPDIGVLVSASNFFASKGIVQVRWLVKIAWIIKGLCHLFKIINFLIAKTIHYVIIHHSHGLHKSVTDGRTDKGKTMLLQILAHGIGFDSLGGKFF